MAISEEQLRVLSELAGIEISPAHIPGVLANLETLIAQAALLFEPPVDSYVEPAPVFNP